MAETPQSLAKIVNASGFPLQLRVEREIEQAQSFYDWEVVAREHYWKGQESGDDGYIDIVLQNGSSGTGRMVIECKRILDTSWVFLIPDMSQMEVRRTRILWTDWMPEGPPLYGWNDVTTEPLSPESAFCAVRGQSSRHRPMLERVTDSLLQSVESLAVEELSILQEHHSYRTWRIYVPVIVTTARLDICCFDPSEIDIQNGQLPDYDEARFETVPYLRFRKGLTSDLSGTGVPRNLEQANKYSERTVFIVNAGELTTFLEHWQIIGSEFRDWPWDVARNRVPSRS